MVIRELETSARLELPQLCLDISNISSIPFSYPTLGTSGPHLGGANSHPAAVSGDRGWASSERRCRIPRGREDEFCWDVFAEGAVDLAHLLTFCVRVFLLIEKGVGGGGCWTHGEVIRHSWQGRKKGARTGFPNTMIIWGYHDRIEMKNERRGTIGVLGSARHRCRAGGGQIHRG